VWGAHLLLGSVQGLLDPPGQESGSRLEVGARPGLRHPDLLLSTTTRRCWWRKRWRTGYCNLVVEAEAEGWRTGLLVASRKPPGVGGVGGLELVENGLLVASWRWGGAADRPAPRPPERFVPSWFPRRADVITQCLSCWNLLGVVSQSSLYLFQLLHFVSFCLFGTKTLRWCIWSLPVGSLTHIRCS